jgi:sulfofructose kinase
MIAHVFCLGVAVQDYVFSLPEMPRAAKKHRAADFTIVGGGCAANAAVAVVRLGGRASLATRLGADKLGDDIVADLEAEGVDCAYAGRFEGRRSSLSAVMVDAHGDRMIVNYRDPKLPEGADWLPDPTSLGLGAVLADTRWPTGAAAIMRRARDLGLTTVLDAEPPIAPAEDALRAASHIAFSRDGLAEWSGTDDLEEGLASVASDTGAFVCVTDGARGVRFHAGKERGKVPAFAVEAVDTLGAGDIWHGAFALALAEGRNETDAIRFASAAAALKCTQFGGRAAMPARREVEHFLMEHAV